MPSDADRRLDEASRRESVRMQGMVDRTILEARQRSSPRPDRPRETVAGWAVLAWFVATCVFACVAMAMAMAMVLRLMERRDAGADLPTDYMGAVLAIGWALLAGWLFCRGLGGRRRGDG